MGSNNFWLPKFFRISSLVFCRKKKISHIKNDNRVYRWWQFYFEDELFFGCTCIQIHCNKIFFSSIYSSKCWKPKILYEKNIVLASADNRQKYCRLCQFVFSPLENVRTVSPFWAKEKKFTRLIRHLKWTGTEQAASAVQIFGLRNCADGSTNVFL